MYIVEGFILHCVLHYIRNYKTLNKELAMVLTIIQWVTFAGLLLSILWIEGCVEFAVWAYKTW